MLKTLAKAVPTAVSKAARAARAAATLALGLALVPSCQAGVGPLSRHCDETPEPTAAQQARALRFSAIVRAELDRAGADGRHGDGSRDSAGGEALIARSGLDLGRFDMRYSHAGVALQASSAGPWAVRQLYYACDERRPRVFDQGLAAFTLGTHAPAPAYVSAVLLPPAYAAMLERAALDDRRALALLHADYSANAHAFALRYQNCNQWVAELLAASFGAAAGTDADDALPTRAAAQAWLRDHGYTPAVFDLGSRPLMWLSSLLPWVHRSDHPDIDLENNRYRVSMPASIEAFVRRTVPGAVRIEFCHTELEVVVHRGWTPMAEGCRAELGDTLIAFD